MGKLYLNKTVKKKTVHMQRQKIQPITKKKKINEMDQKMTKIIKLTDKNYKTAIINVFKIVKKNKHNEKNSRHNRECDGTFRAEMQCLK